jgi:dTMP kinase
MLITVEGAEGAGKSTLVKILAEELISKGRSVIVSKEPGGTEVGKQIREILVNDKTDSIYPVPQLLLLLADRIQHIHSVILPALRKGKIVISDRYMDTTWVYQGIMGKQDFIIQNLIKNYGLSLLQVKPDLTIFANVSENTSRVRLQLRNDVNAYDDKYMNHSISLNKSYVKHFAKEKERNRIIFELDANPTFPEVVRVLKENIETFLTLPRRYLTEIEKHI